MKHQEFKKRLETGINFIRWFKYAIQGYIFELA